MSLKKYLAVGSIVLFLAWLGAFAQPATSGSPAESGEPEEQTAQKAPDRPEKGIGQEELAASSSLAMATQGEEGLSLQTMCTNCNEANLDLGGFGDEHIEVSRDGSRLMSGLPRIYAFGILPTPALEKLEIDSGPGYAEHSCDAIGGTVMISSHEPARKPRVQVGLESGSYGWEKQSVFADGKLGIFSGRVAATRSAFDPIDADGDGNVETGAIDQWTALAEVGVDLRRFGNITLGGTRIRDEQIDGHGQVEKDFWTNQPIGYLPEDTFVTWKGYTLGYDLNLPKGHSISLRVGDYVRDQEINSPPVQSDEEKANRYMIVEDTTLGEIKWQGPIGMRWLLSAGLSTDEDVNNVSGGSMPSHLRVLEESVEGWGAFAQAGVELHPRLALTFGTRYDDYEYSSCRVDPETVWPPEPPCETVTGSEWNPRATLNWKPLDRFQVKTSFGYGNRVPKPVFSEICCGQTPERNANVKPERSKSVALDVTYQPSPALKLNLYLHHSEFRDYIIKMVGGSIDLKQKLMQGNITEATIDGASAFVSWETENGISLSGSYTLLDAGNEGDTITLYPTEFEGNDKVEVVLPLTQIPYLAKQKGQLTLRFAPPGSRFSTQIQTQYTGSMLIQYYWNIPGGLGIDPPGGLIRDYRKTDDFWTVNASSKITVYKYVDLVLGIDNMLNYVQDDLHDFSTDYNWGPVRGRYYYGGLNFRF